MRDSAAAQPLAYGKPKSKAKKKVVGMHISKGASGGYIVRHEHEMHPSEDHVMPDQGAMLAHVKQNMGEGSPAEEAGESPAQEANEA